MTSLSFMKNWQDWIDGKFLPIVMILAIVILETVTAIHGHRQARADESIGFLWENGIATYTINPNFPEELAGSRERQIEIIRCAADVWVNQTRADIQFTYEGETEKQAFMMDGENTVSFSDIDGNGALAATCFFGNAEGLYEDFDITFFSHNGEIENRWSGLNEPGSGTWDIMGIAVHELGHGLGVGHLNEPQATMFLKAPVRALTLRTLHEADIFCIEMLYGTHTSEFPEVEILSVEPISGQTAGGNEILISGTNFTYTSDTLIKFNNFTIPNSLVDVDSCNSLRITMPSHDPGVIDITVANAVDSFVALDAYEYVGPPLVFSRGDSNVDGKENIADVLSILGNLFLGKPSKLLCDKSGDLNDDGAINVADAQYQLNSLFLGGPPPPFPYPACGVDTTSDSLSCDFPPICE